MDTKPAADLLQWMDISSEVDVMTRIQGSLPGTVGPLAVPVTLEVSTCAEAVQAP